jgi:hypothetical protein
MTEKTAKTDHIIVAGDLCVRIGNQSVENCARSEGKVTIN